MKDPYVVLREKEWDVARVRSEIAALLTIIPLLSDNSCAGSQNDAVLDSRRQKQNVAEDSMTELKRYYPFIRHLRS